MKKLPLILSILTLITFLFPAASIAQSPVKCEEEYVVQAGDWLSKIAEKEFNDPLAYPALVILSNALADDDYTNIDNPDLIEPGWTICIPSADDLPDLLAEAGPVAQAAARSVGIQIPPTLEDTLWVLVAQGDALNPDVVEAGTLVAAQFSKDGSLSGSGGCNTYNSTYQLGDDNEISIEPAASTRKACPIGMEQEQTYLTALPQAESYEITAGGLLKINYNSGKVFEEALYYAPGQAELQNTQWILQAYGAPDDLQSVEAGTTITAVFTGEAGEDKGTIVGFAGCNTYSADYKIRNDKLTVKNPASTRKTCPLGVEQEQVYLSMLSSARTYKIIGRQLQITTKDSVLIFTSANLPLEHVLWTLESYGDPGAQQLVPAGTDITALFISEGDGSAGKISGFGGCNTYNTGYEKTGRQLTIGPSASTLMACPGGMDVEQAYLAALQSVENYQVLGDQLRLKYNDGQSVLTYRANRTPLEGAYWELVSYGAITDPRPPFEGTHFTAVFDRQPDAPSGIMTGTTGCNEYNATYVASLTNIKVDLPFRTKEFCGDGIAEMEQAYFLGLNSAADYRIMGDVLQIVYDDGRQALNFVASQPPALAPTAIINAPAEAQVGDLITFDGSASSGENEIVQYHWDLGDGTRLSTAVVQHAYSAAGTYNVTLTVVDSEGLSSTAAHKIKSSAIPETPPTAVIEGPTQGVVGESLTFQGGNSIPGSSPIVVYAWHVSGLQAAPQSVNASFTVTFDKPGVYEVGLTVTDQNNLSDSAAIQVEIKPKDEPQIPPTAVIEGPTQAFVNDSLTFFGGNSIPGSSPIAAYAWDFGNSSGSSEVNASTVYNAPGVYNVTLTVTDQNGLTGAAAHRLEISEKDTPQTPPTAVIEGPTQASVGETVTFSAANSQPGSSPIAAYIWDLGNGSSGNEVTASTVYNSTGSYSVGLTVVDQNGISGNTTAQISIADSNAPLEGPVWVLENTIPDTIITAEFNNGGLSGSSGCNSYNGSYITSRATNNNVITISNLTSTQLLCAEDVMTQEQTYLAALAAAQKYQTQSNVLTIIFAGGTLTYRVQAQPR